MTPLAQKLFDEAEVYQKHSFNGSGEGSVTELIKQVAQNQSFNKDPEEYLNAWLKRRGSSEQYRFPEDRVIRILEEFLKKNSRLLSKEG